MEVKMGDDKKLDKVPEGVPDPLENVLQYKPCPKFGCIGLNYLGCLGMSHSRVVAENASSIQFRDKPREHSPRDVLKYIFSLQAGLKKKWAVLITAWFNEYPQTHWLGFIWVN